MNSKVLIVFGSQYGFTEKYAKWIAEDLQNQSSISETSLISAENLSTSHIADSQIVIIGTSDYGGFLTGAPEISKFSTNFAGKELVFFTVSFSGLDGASQEKLDALVGKNFGELATAQPIFHFRGGLDHNRLSFKHKAVMVGIRAGISALPHKNEANRQMLDSFAQGSVDYSARQSIEPLLARVMQLAQE